MSAIDLEHYWVDVRFTNLAAAAGFVLHTLWTPSYYGQTANWHRPGDGLAVASILALVGLAITWLYLVCQYYPQAAQADLDEQLGTQDEVDSDDAPEKRRTTQTTPHPGVDHRRSLAHTLGCTPAGGNQ